MNKLARIIITFIIVNTFHIFYMMLYIRRQRYSIFIFLGKISDTRIKNRMYQQIMKFENIRLEYVLVIGF